jgi:uncharacterized Ntn-hydrolase superfamily protein
MPTAVRRAVVAALLMLSCLPAKAWATWSIIVLDRSLEAVQKARAAGRPLEEVVMAGLRAGADASGDSRCGAQRATTAFLAVAKPGDVPNWPYLTLRVVGVEKGDRVNAVEMLEKRLELWRANGGAKLQITNETVKPEDTLR